jgi:hypothetical protein
MSITGKTVMGQVLDMDALLKKSDVVYGLIVTPDLAEYFLEICGKEFNNRPINQDRVDAYGRDMKTSNWRHNGETIKFDTSGILVDGYTRLTAAFYHSADFVTDVRTGVDKDAVATIDTGRPRSLSNVLSMRNETTATALSQGANWLSTYQEGNIYRRKKLSRSHQEMVDFIEKHQRLREAVEATKEVRNKRLAPPGVLVAAFYVCSANNHGKAVEFFHLLASGVGYTQTSPVRHLRDLLLQRGQRRLMPAETFALILHAYNKHAKNEQVKILRLPGDEYTPKVKPARVG